MSRPDYWSKAIKHLSKNDKVLAGIIKSYKGEFLKSRGDAFFTLARAIIGQQISVKAADSIWQRFEKLTKANPKKVLKTADAKLREIGLSNSKVNYVKNIAEFCIANPNVWHTHDDESLIKELVKIKGVGRWTAEMYLIFGELRSDVLPLADLALLKAFEKHYGLNRKKMEKHAEIWRPYRSVASWYLWRSLDPVPVEY